MNLPVMYVCENNNYAMGTSVERGSAGGGNFHSKYTWASGIKFNGHNLFEVREAIKYAKKYCLEHGPIFVNINTYRYHGHSMSDPGITYRTREEVSDVRKTRDPIQFLKKQILDNDLMTEKELKEIDKEIKKSIQKSADKALKQEEFSIETLTDDVFAPDRKFYVRAPNYEDSKFIKEDLIN